MKIIDKVRKYEAEDAVYFSFEFFPPKTEDGVANLYQRLDRMAALNPAFIDVTWGAGGSTSERTLEICKNAQVRFCFCFVEAGETNQRVLIVSRALRNIWGWRP